MIIVKSKYKKIAWIYEHIKDVLDYLIKKKIINTKGEQIYE